MKRLPRRTAEMFPIEEQDRNDKGLIKVVRVAAAFWQDPELPKGSGNLCFVCPFCRAINMHSAGNANFPNSRKPVFGAYDGSRTPHCGCQDMTSSSASRACSQKVYCQLAPGWQFHLTEVEDATRAGEFPVNVQRHLTSRKVR